MKKVGMVISIFASLLFVNQAIAFQEIKDAAIVDYDIIHMEKICTITIDRDIPTSASTEKCTQRAFSWKCLSDDYLWHMVLHIYKNKLPIDIRYSSDGCFDEKSGNFKLLTVW